MHRFPSLAAATSAVGIAVLILACSSVPDVTFSDDASTSSTSSGGSSGASSGGNEGGIKDAPSDCKATGPEDCFNGLDDDCNGHIDCEDPACSPATQCIEPAPAGWTLISFADTTRPSCATGYDTPVDLKVVSGTGIGTCSCACDVTAGTACANGVFSVVVDSSSCSTTGASLPANANCTALPGGTSISVPTGGSVVAKATPPSGPTTCTGVTTVPGNAPSSGRSCSVAADAKFGKGCGAGTQLCAPRAVGFSVCVTKPGANACPTPYTKLSTAGTDAVDTRACNTCSCEPKGCSGTVSLFSALDCTTGGAKHSIGPLDATCSAVTDKNWDVMRYKTTLSGAPNGCGIATGGFDSAMQGQITWTDQRTVCCKP